MWLKLSLTHYFFRCLHGVWGVGLPLTEVDHQVKLSRSAFVLCQKYHQTGMVKICSTTTAWKVDYLKHFYMWNSTHHFPSQPALRWCLSILFGRFCRVWTISTPNVKLSTQTLNQRTFCWLSMNPTSRRWPQKLHSGRRLVPHLPRVLQVITFLSVCTQISKFWGLIGMLLTTKRFAFRLISRFSAY